MTTDGRRPEAGATGSARGRLLTLGLGLGVALAVATPNRAGAATVAREFSDPAGQGFNDPTPANPVGGNTGTTLGQQRRNVVNRALDMWGQRLQSPQTIRVAVTLMNEDLPCNANAAVIGAASADHHLVWRGPAGAPHPMTNVVYPAALYDRLANFDAMPGAPDVLAAFNGRLGQAGCGEGLSLYLGLDSQTPRDGIDLLQVVLHEFAHAVGFASLVDAQTGNFATDGNGALRMDPYSTLLYDNVTQKRWPALTAAQRRASLRSNGQLLWDGALATQQAARLPATSGCRGASNRLRMYAPPTVMPASSVSHWDTPCTPDLLMEPFTGAKPFLDLTPAVLADIGWGLSGACGDGVTNDGEQCDSGDGNGMTGASCSALCLGSSPQTCGNGVIGGSEQCDDGPDNGSPYSCCTIGCALKKVGSTCRPVAGTCDLEETCSGQSAVCPPDLVRPAGTACRPIAGLCDVAEACTGADPQCPDDVVFAGGPPCRASIGFCDPPEFCAGDGPGCPADRFTPAGTQCEDGNVCTTSDSCQNGACTAGPPVVCPDHGECFLPGQCDPAAAVCRSMSRPNGAPCSIGACFQGTCMPVVEPPPVEAPEPTVEPTAEPVVEPVVEPAVEPAPDAGVEPVGEPTVEPAPDAGVDQPVAPAPDAGDAPADLMATADTGAEDTAMGPPDLGGPTVDASAGADADARTMSVDGGDAAPAPPITAPSSGSGCGCAIDGGAPSGTGFATLLLAALIGIRRRRR